MSRRRSSRQTRGYERRWRIPPPVVRDPDSAGPEGMIVLREFPSELGTLLWTSLRNVVLWSGVDLAARRGLFGEGSYEQRLADILTVAPDRILEEPLTEIAGLLRNPEAVDPQTIALACTRIAQWANEREAFRTSVEYYQAAALSCPADAQHALAVGRAARDRALYPRAESWLQRGIGLSRQAQDWETYSRTYIALGNMMLKRGALPAARRNLIKALRRSIRQGIAETEAMALHDLFVLEVECGNMHEAQNYAARALRAYGPGHRLLPTLAHDVAYFWLQQGYFAQALPVFQAALPFVSPVHEANAIGSLARAAGAVGNAEGVDWAIRMLEGRSGRPGLANAWVDVGWGAASLSRFQDAAKAGERAAAMAESRGEGKVRFLADALLEAVRKDRRVNDRVRGEPAAAADLSTEELASDLIESLASSTQT
jgi:tetratricopeptide (TPR) repeat protein